MKRNLKNILFLASIVAIGFVIFKSVDAKAIASIGIEAKRYNGINARLFGLAVIFILMSFLMGWVTSKINRADR